MSIQSGIIYSICGGSRQGHYGSTIGNSGIKLVDIVARSNWSRGESQKTRLSVKLKLALFSNKCIFFLQYLTN